MPKQFSNKEAAIRWYLDCDFVLFPLQGKVPPKGCHWRESEYDPFFESPGNFGVQLPNNVLVIDADPRNGGSESFNKLIEKTGAFVDTFIVVTGSGGQHIYLTKPEGLKIRKNIPHFKGIDFISAGGYVVGAGSIHPTTNRLYVGYPSQLMAAPKELLELIEKQVIDIAITKEVVHDDPETKERYSSWLGSCPVAIAGEAGNATTYRVACQGRDFGLSQQATLEEIADNYNLRCEPCWSLEELAKIVENAYKYATDIIGNKAVEHVFEVWTEEKIDEHKKILSKYLQQNAAGTAFKNNMHNVTMLFRNEFAEATGWKQFYRLIGFNEFKRTIEFLRPAPWFRAGRTNMEWDDGDLLECKFWLANLLKFEPTTANMLEGAYVGAQDNVFHPIKDYLKSLVWDRHYRCSTWLIDVMGAEDNKYTRAVALKWLVAAVKRIFEPGCKFDYIPTLEGPQGTFKSTIFSTLAVKDDWFCELSVDNISNKDTIFIIDGKWIIEVPEMHTFGLSVDTAMKSFLSRKVDRARQSYGKFTKDYPRQCVFAGTINPHSDIDVGWMKDPTGNRRHWPVKIGVTKESDLTGLAKIVPQLWAEAYQLYLQRVPIYFEDRSIEDMAKAEQQKRMGSDPWQDAIEVWLDHPNNINKNVFTGDEIYIDCINGSREKYSRVQMMRLSQVMQKIGWVKDTFYDKITRKPLRGYKRPEVLG